MRTNDSSARERNEAKTPWNDDFEDFDFDFDEDFEEECENEYEIVGAIAEDEVVFWSGSLCSPMDDHRDKAGK